MYKKFLPLMFLFLIFSLGSAAPPTEKYQPGETIDPGCAPGDINCDVLIESNGDLTDDAWVNNAADDRIELGSNSDGTPRGDAVPFVIKDNGRVGIGTEDPQTILHLESDGGFVNPRLFSRNDVNWQGSFLNFMRGRGSSDTPLKLEQDDVIGYLDMWGYDGGSFGRAGQLSAEVDGTVTDGSIPMSWTFDTGTKYSVLKIKDNGNVGIGSANPSSILEVAKSGSLGSDEVNWISAITQYMDGDSSGGQYGLKIGRDTNGDYNGVPLANRSVGLTAAPSAWGNDVHMGFWTGGAHQGEFSEKMRLTNTGRLVLGDLAASDGSGNGGEHLKLDVEGAVGATHYCDENGENCSTASSLLSGGGSSDNLGNHTATENIILGTKYLSGDGDDEGVFVDEDGSVGVGTDNPIHPLHVLGATVVEDGNLYIDSTKSYPGINMTGYGDNGATHILAKRANGTKDAPLPVEDGDIILSFQARGYDGTTFPYGTNPIVIQSSETWNSTSRGTEIVFRTVENGTDNGVERMIIQDDGNVGIGILNPSEKLEVDGNIQIRGEYGGNNGTFGALKFFNTTTASNSVLAQIDGVRGLNHYQRGVLSFKVKDSNDLKEAMRIDSFGRVAIGTETPNSKLEVVNGYIELDVSAGIPPGTDCDNADEIGRMKVDDSNANFYICTALGWVTK